MAVFAGLVAQRVVGERLEGRLERVDALHHGPQLADLAFVKRAENLLGEIEHVADLKVRAPDGSGGWWRDAREAPWSVDILGFCMVS